MKKIISFLSVFLFLFSLVVFGQRVDGKKELFPYLRIGADPQNLLRTLEPGELLVKYIGKNSLRIITNSGSGKESNGLIRSGFGAFVKARDYEGDDIKDFTIFNCGNDSYLPGSRGKTLYLPKDSLLVICSYEQIHGSNLLLPDSLHRRGEFENLADNAALLSDKIIAIDERTARIERFLKGNSNNFPQQLQKDSGFPWVTVGEVVAVVAGIVAGYLFIRNNTGGKHYKTTTSAGGSGGGNLFTPPN